MASGKEYVFIPFFLKYFYYYCFINGLQDVLQLIIKTESVNSPEDEGVVTKEEIYEINVEDAPVTAECGEVYFYSSLSLFFYYYYSYYYIVIIIFIFLCRMIRSHRNKKKKNLLNQKDGLSNVSPVYYAEVIIITITINN